MKDNIGLTVAMIILIVGVFISSLLFDLEKFKSDNENLRISNTHLAKDLSQCLTREAKLKRDLKECNEMRSNLSEALKDCRENFTSCTANLGKCKQDLEGARNYNIIGGLVQNTVPMLFTVFVLGIFSQIKLLDIKIKAESWKEKINFALIFILLNFVIDNLLLEPLVSIYGYIPVLFAVLFIAVLLLLSRRS